MVSFSIETIVKRVSIVGYVLAQYVEDLLLASKDEESHMRDRTTLVDILAEQGHKSRVTKHNMLLVHDGQTGS